MKTTYGEVDCIRFELWSNTKADGLGEVEVIMFNGMFNEGNCGGGDNNYGGGNGGCGGGLMGG